MGHLASNSYSSRHGGDITGIRLVIPAVSLSTCRVELVVIHVAVARHVSRLSQLEYMYTYSTQCDRKWQHTYLTHSWWVALSDLYYDHMVYCPCS